MKLVFVHDGPLFIGPDNHYYEFAYHNLYERYAHLANEVTFLIRVDKISSEHKFTKVPDEINVIAVPNFKRINGYIGAKRRAIEIIKKTILDSDIVVLRTQSSIAQIAEKYVRKYDKPYIIECVGCSWDAYWNHSIMGKFLAPFMEYRTKKIIARASWVYYVTSEFLQKQYPSPKAKTIACSNVVIDMPKNDTLEKRINRIQHFKPNKKIVLGTAASIDTKYKGQQYVIEAIALLEKQGYEIEYKLAGGRNGSSNEENHLVSKARSLGIMDKITFCGSLSKDDMNDYYDSLDIYIQPSKQEGLPRSVIEAMSHACPVLGSNIAGIPELIDKECLFEKGNVKSITEHIISLVNSDLCKYAKNNFIRSKDYVYTILEEKRDIFYTQFIIDNGLDKHT